MDTVFLRMYMGKIARTLGIDFLSDNPNGIRVVHSISFRHFRAYIIPRQCMCEVSKLDFDGKIGIYFLFDKKRTNVYIGQTVNGKARIQTHHQRKKNWDVAIMFLANKDEWISSIDELETYAIIRLEKAIQNGSQYILQNVNKKGRSEESLTNLDPIKDIFMDIEFCLAAFDYNIEPASSSKKDVSHSDIPVLATRGGIKAKGLYNPDDNSIIVKAGSEIRYDVKAFGENINKQRQELKETGKIKKVKGKYILQEDVSFDKLSPAAEFVIGGSCNGKTEWKSNGKTLKELYEL